MANSLSKEAYLKFTYQDFRCMYGLINIIYGHTII